MFYAISVVFKKNTISFFSRPEIKEREREWKRMEAHKFYDSALFAGLFYRLCSLSWVLLPHFHLFVIFKEGKNTTFFFIWMSSESHNPLQYRMCEYIYMLCYVLWIATVSVFVHSRLSYITYNFLSFFLILIMNDRAIQRTTLVRS